MTPQQAALFLHSHLQTMHGSLSPGAQAALASIGSTLASNPQAAVRALWNLALTEIKNPVIQRTALNLARPVLGTIGVAWGSIEISCVALTGLTVGALVLEIMFWIAVAVLVVLLLLVLIWLLTKLVEFLIAALSWTPARKPSPPMQQPNWGRLLNLLHDPSMGPLYTIESQAKPTAIMA